MTAKRRHQALSWIRRIRETPTPKVGEKKNERARTKKGAKKEKALVEVVSNLRRMVHVLMERDAVLSMGIPRWEISRMGASHQPTW